MQQLATTVDNAMIVQQHICTSRTFLSCKLTSKSRSKVSVVDMPACSKIRMDTVDQAGPQSVGSSC